MNEGTVDTTYATAVAATVRKLMLMYGSEIRQAIDNGETRVSFALNLGDPNEVSISFVKERVKDAVRLESGTPDLFEEE